MLTVTGSLPFPSHISPSTIRRKSEAVVVVNNNSEDGGSGRKANLTAKRKERIKLPKYGEARGKEFPIREFLHHQSGVEALLNTRALQSFEPIDANTYRCTLPNVRLLNFDAVPVVDLRVTPTSEDCKVEMLSCKFEGSSIVEKQNQLFSAFMINHITWEENCPDPSLEVDVTLNLTLEVFKQPLSLLPISMVEKPGNLVMQALIDRLVPLLIQQLLQDYDAWIKEQL